MSTAPGTQPATGMSAYSRFVQRIRRRYADQMGLLPEGPPVRAAMEQGLQALLATGLETGAALRVLRQLVMERLVVIDCDPGTTSQATLTTVTRAMTELAELALDVAVMESRRVLDELHGAPTGQPQDDTPGPQPCAQLWVVGMGKLGARELNVS
eukprot:gene13041-15938_t